MIVLSGCKNFARVGRFVAVWFASRDDLSRLFWVFSWSFLFIFGLFAAAIPANASTLVSGNAVVLVNSQSTKYSDFQHFIQPYLDNFGFPYVVQDISTNVPSESLTNYAVIIIGHSQLDTNQTFLNGAAQNSISLAVSNGTGLVNFDSNLANGTTARYQFIQDIFGFSYGSSGSASSVSIPPTEPSSQMHYITAAHSPNDTINYRSSITMPGISLPGNATTLASSGGKPLVAIRKYGLGRAVQWGSYGWMVSTVLGPVDGLDDLLWRGVVWSARKPFVMRGIPPMISMRVDDVSGPLTWAHIANESGFKPLLAVFINEISAADSADIRNLVTNGNATACVHSFASSTMFYFNHQTETANSDIVQSNNFVIGTQWHQTNGIPISKVCATHYSEIGPNAFAGLKAWGMEFVPIEVVPGTVEYYSPFAPWVVAGPYRLYETPQQGQVPWPTYYADWLTVPGHPEFNGQFFNAYSEVRDGSNCGEWCPDNDVFGSTTRGTTILKREFDSMVMATLFTHEWYFHPTPCCGNTTITPENLRAMFQGITNNLGAYKPSFVTLDYASKYVRATRTSRLVNTAIDPSSGNISVTLTGKTDLDTSVYVFTGEDSAINYTFGNVPEFATTSNNTVVVSGPPDVMVTPAGQTNNAGAPVTFIARTIGTPPFTYQWLRNGATMLNGSNSSLTINAAFGADAGGYSVIVGNMLGSITSAPPAVLTVIDPVITNQPASQNVTAGGTATLSVGAAGTSLNYQWLRGGLVINGANAASLTLSNVAFTDATNYAVVVSNLFNVVTSSPAALTVVLVPQANNDSFALRANTTLEVLAPGVLANDSDTAGNPLTSLLVTPPLHGALKLSDVGEFTYVAETNFVGADSFAYRAANFQTNSVPAIVSLSITSSIAFASDDFMRLVDPGPLSPWVAQSGAWSVTGGVLRGGENTAQSYGFAYLPAALTNYAVESQLRFSTTSAWGGGIGGRLNPTTGSHYAAWIYPDASGGGANQIKLIKFQNWSSFAYNNVAGAVMQTVNLASVGTNWHSLKLAFHGNRIAVYFDQRLVISMADSEALPYASGGISADLWTAAAGYQMFVDKIVARPLAVNDSFALPDATAYTNAPPGVLTNDTGVYSTNLVASLSSAPAHGAVSLDTNGGFVYTPTPGFFGPDSFVYQLNDGSNNLGTATVRFSVGGTGSPLIVEQPVGVTMDAGAAVQLSAKVLGAAPLAYQWFLNGTNRLANDVKVTGATDATLTISNLLGGDAGYYTLVVSNAAGSITSAPPSLLAVNDPVISSQPLSRTNISGTTATFEISAHGTQPAYQWLKAGTPISSATSSTLTLANVSTADVADYSVVVSNHFGNLTSQIAQLALVPAPSIASVVHTNEMVAITWSSIVGYTYRVQYRNGFKDPIWHDVPPDVVAVGSLSSKLAPFGNLAQRFYRVILVRPLESAFMITDFKQTNGTAAVTWNSVSGQNYRLQYKDGLADPQWHDLLPGVTAGGITTSAASSNGVTSRRMFRVALGQGTPPPPQISGVTVTNQVATVAWNSVAGQTYRLQYKDSLADPAWHTIVPDIVASAAATGGTNDVSTALRRFFRVVLLP